MFLMRKHVFLRCFCLGNDIFGFWSCVWFPIIFRDIQLSFNVLRIVSVSYFEKVSLLYSTAIALIYIFRVRVELETTGVWPNSFFFPKNGFGTQRLIRFSFKVACLRYLKSCGECTWQVPLGAIFRTEFLFWKQLQDATTNYLCTTFTMTFPRLCVNPVNLAQASIDEASFFFVESSGGKLPEQVEDEVSELGWNYFQYVDPKAGSRSFKKKSMVFFGQKYLGSHGCFD